jgi:hypothetical protein
MRYILPAFVLATIVNYSCNSSVVKEHPNKLDTFPRAAFRIMLPNKTLSAYYVDTAIYQIVSKWAFTDTARSTGGHWQTDTFRFGRIVTDTARDAARKPLFDSLKHPRWASIWYPILKGYVEPSNIPTTLPDSLLPPKPKPNPNAPQTKIEKPTPDTTKH